MAGWWGAGSSHPGGRERAYTMSEAGFAVGAVGSGWGGQWGAGGSGARTVGACVTGVRPGQVSPGCVVAGVWTPVDPTGR